MQSKPMAATKSDLINAVAEENGFPQNKSAEVIETLIGLIKTKLAAGEAMTLEARKVVTIKCSGQLKDKINKSQ